jgi:hypothetical protein
MVVHNIFNPRYFERDMVNVTKVGAYMGRQLIRNETWCEILVLRPPMLPLWAPSTGS